jgi:hypothetical protein
MLCVITSVPITVLGMHVRILLNQDGESRLSLIKQCLMSYLCNNNLECVYNILSSNEDFE